jgi:hypothetical protein
LLLSPKHFDACGNALMFLLIPVSGLRENKLRRMENHNTVDGLQSLVEITYFM